MQEYVLLTTIKVYIVKVTTAVHLQNAFKYAHTYVFIKK
jgi:hypothetical protein